MTSDPAVAYLRSLIPADGGLGGPFDLQAIRAALKALGDPHADRRFVHVGGTSGKGSTAIFLASILTAAGYRTGLHVSPHVVREHERAQVDGVDISDHELAELAVRLRSAASSEQLSYFEALWAIALLHFQRRTTDVDVVEVGLGGALDATNVIASRHQILTNIGLDHQHVLGRTKSAILRIKQGIVKPGSRVVSGIREPYLRAILEEHAREQQAEVRFVGRDFQVRMARQVFAGDGLPAHVTFTYTAHGVRLGDMAVALPGRGQASNAALAVATALHLADDLPRIDEHAIRAGLLSAKAHGRVDVVACDPLTIFDGAHNPSKMRWLAAAIRDAFGDRRFVSVFRFTQRPDIWSTLATLATFSEKIILTDSRNPGDMGTIPGYDDAALKRARAQFGATAIRSPREALEMAVEHARGRADSGVLATGSIYMLQELYADLPGRAGRATGGETGAS